MGAFQSCLQLRNSSPDHENEIPSGARNENWREKLRVTNEEKIVEKESISGFQMLKGIQFFNF